MHSAVITWDALGSLILTPQQGATPAHDAAAIEALQSK